jgi:hypothetical protein
LLPFETEAHPNNKYSVRIAKKTPHFYIKNHLIMLFKEITSVYSDNHTKPISKSLELLIVEVRGTWN